MSKLFLKQLLRNPMAGLIMPVLNPKEAHNHDVLYDVPKTVLNKPVPLSVQIKDRSISHLVSFFFTVL